MGEFELALIEELKSRAVKKQWFQIAACLREAEKMIIKKINDKWVEDTLNSNK